VARFLPIVRTVLNPMIGALDVPARMFTIWQVIGGLIWSVGLTLAGYALGSSIRNVDQYLVLIIAVIVVASFVPIVIEVLRHRKKAPRDDAPRGAAGTSSDGEPAQGRDRAEWPVTSTKAGRGRS
jgi:membrane-associated protein